MRFVLAGVAAGALMACTGSPRPRDTAVLASGSDLESANPVVTVHTLSRQMQRHMLFVPLFTLDSLLQPQPALARTWSWNALRTELSIVLRDDVYWHDEVRTTARDVALTFNAVRDVETGSPRAGDVSAITGVHAINDTLVRFTFSHPQPTLPLVLAELPPVPAHLLGDVPRRDWRQHAFSTAPTGNGPFRFISRDAGQRWRFARNEAFPDALGGPPHMREIVIAVVDEPATKFAGLVSGDLDVAGISPSMASLVSRDPLLVLETPPVLFTTMLAFNTTRAPFNDLAVRQAVSLALNRQRIVDAAVAGFAVPAAQAVPPGVFGDAPVPAIANVDSANALLDRAGWTRGTNGSRSRDGQSLSFTLLTVSTGDLAVEQLIQDDLRPLGIGVTIRSAELATFLSALRATEKTYDVAFTGVPGDLGLGHLAAMFHSAQRGGALDYTGFHSRTLDAAIDAARIAGSRDERRIAWNHVNELLAASVPVVFVYHAQGVQGRARSLDGVVMDLRGELATIARWRRRDE